MNGRKLIWPFSLYFLFFAGVATHRPFLVLYYQSLSFTGAQIGLLTGMAPLITLVSVPLIAGFADRANKHGLIMGLSLLALVLGLVFYPYLKSFALIFGLTLITTVAFSPIMPLSNSATMFMLGDRKGLYGRVRLGGTIGYGVVGTLAGALIEKSGLRFAFWSAAGVFFVVFLVSRKLVYGGEESGDSADRGRTSELLKNPHFLLFLLIAFSGGVSFATLNTYLFPYMKALGAGESMMGLALTIGTIAEIPVLFFASRFIKRFDVYTVMVFSIAMTGLRLLLLAVVADPIFVLFVQLLNGLNYPLLMVAGVPYADEQAPQGLRATAQGLFNTSLGGIGSAIGGFVGGLLLERMGAREMYSVLAGFMALVLVLVSLFRRVLPPEKGVEASNGVPII